MTHQLFVRRLLIVGLLGLLLALASTSLLAQSDLGEPVPPRDLETEGDAEWEVADATYDAEFPEGMTFTVKAASSAGDITSARVVWQHAPGNNTFRSQGADYDDNTGRWVAFWPHDSGDIPPWVLVRYRWELTDAEGNRYFSAETDEVYADADNIDRWSWTESEDAVVYWMDLPDSYGEQTLQALAERREFYLQAWGGPLPFRPRIILYDRTAINEYEDALGRVARAGGGITTGTTSDDWGGSIQLAYGDTAESLAYGTVLHEVAHLYQGEYAQLPVGWFVEGNAEFFSLARGEDNYRSWSRNRLLSSDPLSFETGFSIRGQTFRDGYQLGATVFDYLVETYGLDAHREVWEMVGRNVPPYTAIEDVTGRTIEEFEMDWRRWLGVNTVAPTAVPSPTPIIDVYNFPTPTYAAPGG